MEDTRWVQTFSGNSEQLWTKKGPVFMERQSVECVLHTTGQRLVSRSRWADEILLDVNIVEDPEASMVSGLDGRLV